MLHPQFIQELVLLFNMEKFEVGDIVKCINVSFVKDHRLNPPLKLNREYIVYGILICKCGKVSLDVGLIAPLGPGECDCGYRVIDDIWWCGSHRFIKRQSVEDRIEEAVEEEDYELAHELSTL